MLIGDICEDSKKASEDDSTYIILPINVND
jgi:hypothetical protein